MENIRRKVSCCMIKKKMIVLGYKTEFSGFINKKKMEEKKTFFLLAKSTSKTIFIEIYFLFSRNCLCFPADSKMDAGEEFA